MLLLAMLRNASTVSFYRLRKSSQPCATISRRLIMRLVSHIHWSAPTTPLRPWCFTFIHFMMAMDGKKDQSLGNILAYAFVRSARLLGNLIARKCGYPSVFRHIDKTIQLTAFLEASIHTMNLQESIRRSRQGRLSMATKKENTSTWF